MNEITLSPSLPRSTTLIRVLGIVATLSGLLIVTVQQLTQPLIEANKQRSVERAIFQILPSAKTRQTFMVAGGSLQPWPGAPSNAELVHAAYDAHGQLVGVALEAAAQGYQDTVRLLYAFDPQQQCIIGFSVLKSAETPGLGTKISTDPDFLANFQCLDARVNERGDGLHQPIQTVKHGTKQHPWQIDAISGATVTSKAVGKMLNDSGQRLHPIVMRHLELLRAAGQQR